MTLSLPSSHTRALQFNEMTIGTIRHGEVVSRSISFNAQRRSRECISGNR